MRVVGAGQNSGHIYKIKLVDSGWMQRLPSEFTDTSASEAVCPAGAAPTQQAQTLSTVHCRHVHYPLSPAAAAAVVVIVAVVVVVVADSALNSARGHTPQRAQAHTTARASTPVSARTCL